MKFVLRYAIGAAAFFMTVQADAAPPFVERDMTLPRHVFAGDVGLGVAHGNRTRNNVDEGIFGPGLNLEGAFGVTEHVELGLRTGLRFGNNARVTQADIYGRTLWTETWGTNVDSVANPEFRVRWAFLSGRVAEIGLDGRAFLPIEDGSRIGLMFGVPFAFHFGALRLDLGVYVPVVFYNEPFVAVTVPMYFWFQVTDRVWLGPMTSLRFIDPAGPPRARTELLVGFGLGIQVASAVDLKTMILFPHINETAGARDWGAGFGVQFRIE